MVGSQAFAANATWNGSSSTDWSDAGNWTPAAAPGSTSTTNNADVATFNTNQANGTTNPLVIDAGRNLRTLTFDTAAGSYTIGSNLGNALSLSSGGNITMAATVAGTGLTQTIAAPLVLQPATATTAGTYTITNASATASNVIVVSGNISGGTTTAAVTLTLNGANTGNNLVSGNISNGGAANLGVTVGAGKWNLSGANSYTGTTSATGGTLVLSGTNSSSGLTNINNAVVQLNNTTANNGGLASGTVTTNNAVIQALVSGLAISNNVVINGTTTFSGPNSLTINGSLTNSGTNRTIANSLGSANTLNLAGNVYLSEASGTGRTLTIGGTGLLNISGNISNFNGGPGTAGSLIFTGTSTTVLSGANTYSGGTTIASSSGPGTALSVSTIGNVGGASSNLGTAGVLTIGSGVNNGKLLYTGVGENTDRVVNLGGTTGNAIIEQAGTGLLNFTSSFTSTGAGTKNLTLMGSTSGAGEISGAIVDNLSGTNNTAVIKTGTGTWTLSGANTYSGITTINGGTLAVANTSGLGTSTLANAVTISTATLSLLNNGAGNNGTIVYGPGSGYNVTTSGNTSTPVINVGNNGANTGNTIQMGSLALASATLTVTNSNGYNLAFAGGATMSGNRTVANNMVGGTTTLASLTSLDAAGRTVTFNGNSSSATTKVGSISQNGAFALNVTQSGLGSLVLTGTNTYTGTTIVSAGTLLINGTHTGGGAYTVGAAGTLGGSGSVSAASLTTAAGSKLTPGGNGVADTFTLAVTGTADLSLASNSAGAYVFDLGATGASDKFVLSSGTLNIGTLDFSDFAFNIVGGFVGGTFVLFDANSAILGSIGTDSGTIGGLAATLSIVGNDVVLNVAAVPEPSTYALVFGGLAALAVLRSRKKKA